MRRYCEVGFIRDVFIAETFACRRWNKDLGWVAKFFTIIVILSIDNIWNSDFALGRQKAEVCWASRWWAIPWLGSKGSARWGRLQRVCSNIYDEANQWGRSKSHDPKESLFRTAEKGSQWLWRNRNESTMALKWVDGIQGVSLGCWDLLLNPLEVSWAYQRNIEERVRPFDNPKDSIPHLIILQSPGSSMSLECNQSILPPTPT